MKIENFIHFVNNFLDIGLLLLYNKLSFLDIIKFIYES